MSAPNLEIVRARLAEEPTRLDRLRMSLNGAEEPVEELSTVDEHPADMGSESFEQTKEVSIRQQIDAQLAELRRAEARVEQGTCGRCEACGSPIGAERLAARPNARFCVDDQRAAERATSATERTP